MYSLESMRKSAVMALFLFSVLAFYNNASGQLLDLKFEHITSENGLPQNTINGIAKDKFGFMWFGTWGGLCRYDGYKFKTYRYNIENNRSINNNRIHNIVKDSIGDIWILTFNDDELCKYNYEKDDFERINKKDVPQCLLKLLHRRDHAQSVTATYKQYKWHLDTYTNRLVQTNTHTLEKGHHDFNYANRWTLNDPHTTDIYKDDHNVFWAGTFSNGINKTNLNAKPFKYYYHDPLKPASIIDNDVRSLCEDHEGNLWIGTRDKGITVMGENFFRHLTHSRANKNTITDNQIRKIYCDSKGLIWIGTKKGLDCFNPKNQNVRHFLESGLANASVFDIMEDANHDLWFATFGGLYKYVSLENRIIHYDPDKTTKHRYAKEILQDKKGQIWVGTEGAGVTVLKSIPGSDSVIVVERFQLNQSSSHTIGDNRINCLYEDSRGYIWIGTANGLERFDPKTRNITHISEKNGLSDATIVGVVEDNKGGIWISHKKGITQLNRNSFNIRNYSLKDGLQSNEFSDGAVLKSSFKNLLYFGGSNGFNAFNPDSIKPENTVPQTVLTELQILNRKVNINEEVNGRVVLKKPLYLTNELVLTDHDKSFTIEFAGLHYSNPNENKYAYKLEGFDDNWNYTDANRRIATYSNLDPGTYTFMVKSSNSDRIWNNKPTTLQITVQPPFYASIWAYLIYLLMGIALLFIYHYYTSKFTTLKSKLSYELLLREKEIELHRNKVQFFTNISHEIKTPLSLILAPIERLAELLGDNKFITEEIKTLRNNGERLLRLVNQLLDFRKLETGNSPLHLRKGDCIAFIKNIVHSFKPISDQKNIDMDVEHATVAFYFHYDEDKLEKVLCNLLSNAVKFTNNGGYIRVKLNTSFVSTSQTVIIEVLNSGKGIPESERELIFKPFQQGSITHKGGTGLGLTFSKGLVELHGGTISVSSSPIAVNLYETKFSIRLPLGESEMSKENPSEEIISDSSIPANSQDTTTYVKENMVLVDGKVPLILIVEDNTDLRNYLKIHLARLYRVIEAENGTEGLVAAETHKPDLIISDVMMPELDGIEFCRKIKSNINTTHIPVILLTAKTPLEEKITGLETGADDYITKPFNLGFLNARVKNLLISRMKLRERFGKELSLKPSENIPVSADEKLLKKLLKYVEDRISDPELNINDICSEIGVSRTHLYRKIKTLTGSSMAEVIKEIRLKRAMQLLENNKFNINEVSYMVGFIDVDYFRKCFKVKYGITPSEYSKRSVDKTVIES